MKGIFRKAAIFLKWVIIAGVLLEVAAFLIINLSNYWIYGQWRDGNPVRYDPYTLFQTVGYPRPTHNNPDPGDRRGCKTFWMFGGSTMSGCTEDDAKTIPSFLAGILNREEPVLPAYVINYGEPSFNSLMETKYLQKVLIENPSRPQVIVFYDGANDCTYFAQDRTPNGGHLGYDRVRGLIESYHRSFFGLLKPLNAALYGSYSRELYDKLRQGVIPIAPDSPQLLRYVDLAAKRYDYVQALAAFLGARFYLIWQPCWWVETEEVSPAVQDREKIIVGRHFALRHNFEVINRALVARLRDKPYFVDFQNILAARKEPAYQSDGIHLQDYGRETVARRMAQIFKEQLRPMSGAGGGSL